MIITFEFSMERGVVNADDMQEEETGNLKKCLDLCKEGRHEEAVTLLMSHIRFEWDWENCDGDVSEFLSESDPIDKQANTDNCALKVGVEDDHLVITATVLFEYSTDLEVDIEQFAEWLDDNSAYACGFVACGAGYDGAGGDKVQIVKVDGQDVNL